MKKIVIALMAAAVLLSMAACDKDKSADNAESTPMPTVSTEPRMCYECDKAVEGIGFEYDGKVYCGRDCVEFPGCARCGGDIEEILNNRKEEIAKDNATSPIPGMTEPGPNAIIFEGKLYCSEECAYF